MNKDKEFVKKLLTEKTLPPPETKKELHTMKEEAYKVLATIIIEEQSQYIYEIYRNLLVKYPLYANEYRDILLDLTREIDEEIVKSNYE